MSRQILAADSSVVMRGAGDDADFAAGLDRERLLDALEAGGDRFQLLHPLDVAVERFAAGAGARGAAGVGRGDEHRVRHVGADVVVVAEGGVDDFGAFAVALEQVGADLRMAAFGVVVGRFADVVQQAGAAGQVGVHAHFFGHHAGDERHFDRMPQHVLAVARAVVQPAEQVDDSLVEAADLRFLHGFFAEAADLLRRFPFAFRRRALRSAWDGCGRRR